MDEYIDPTEDYRCSKCGIHKDSQYYGDVDEDLCEDCRRRYN